MRHVLCAILALGAGLSWAQTGAAPPLARPAPPKVEIRGQAGKQTLYYWAYATDARGHSAYSDPVVVNDAPDALSAENAVVLTPSPVEGATGYGILSSRCRAPRDLKVEIGAKGEKTFYYWTQARNGRTVWSPVEGPFQVDGCADPPENTLTWSDSGAEFYYLYRTETPVQPLGWRGCVILVGGKDTKWSDKNASPEARVISPAGNPAEKPQGEGAYLVGTSDGAPIVDQGQKLTSLLTYDMNTTDPAYRPYEPVTKGYEPSGERGAYQFNFRHTVPSPRYSWDLLNNLTIHQDNVAGGLNVYPRDWSIGSESAKNTYNGIDIHQFNYTPGQHSPYLTFMYNYGLGDNVLFHAALEQQGQNRTAGDEGSEFFSLHMSRRVSSTQVKMAQDAPAGALHLRLEGNPGTVAGARGMVNLSQKYTTGQAHVEGRAKAVGKDTNWTPDMEGRWISFDADTTEINGQPVRQWYLVERYLSPTELQLYAPTYWGKYNYLGRARADGPYLLCPYTEMADGDANRYAEGLKVTPLSCAWHQGDEVEVIAGPQTTFRLGWWEMNGTFLPQDHIAGLGIAYNGNKPTSEGALITYNWGIGLEAHGAGAAVACMDGTKVGMQAYKDTSVLISCIRDDPYRFQLSQDPNGFVIEDYANRRWLALGQKGITLYGDATIAGSQRTRGKSVFSGDGRTVEFAVKFPSAYGVEPFVVASPNLPIGMGVTAVTKEGCTVTFATPPPAGKDNVIVTWMVQE
jgi:hypothetical protein